MTSTGKRSRRWLDFPAWMAWALIETSSRLSTINVERCQPGVKEKYTRDEIWCRAFAFVPLHN